MNKQQRFPITVRINKQARKKLRSLHQILLERYDGERIRSISEGKIIETLLLKEDAQLHVEKELLQK